MKAAGTRLLLIFLCAGLVLCVCPPVLAQENADNGAKAQDADKLAEDVVVELPAAGSADISASALAGTPVIVVLPFSVTGVEGQKALALGFGIAARLVDDYYPLLAVRVITLEALTKSEGASVLNPSAALDNERIAALLTKFGGDYVVTGELQVAGKEVKLSALLSDKDGNGNTVQLRGNLDALPAILTKLSYEVLSTAGASLTDDERKYIDFTEPYSMDAWLSCQEGTRTVTAMLAGVGVTKDEKAKAKLALESALKLYPEYLKAGDAYGRLLFALDDLDGAKAEFQKLKTNYAEYEPVLFYLGVIAYMQKDFAEAKKNLNIAVGLNRRDPAAWLYLGLSQIASDQPASAEQSINAGIGVDPESADLYFALGRALMDQERWGHAAMAFEDAVMRNPALPSAHYNLGICYFRIAAYEKAIKHFKHYMELTPDDPDKDHAKVEGWIAGIQQQMEAKPAEGDDHTAEKQPDSAGNPAQ